MARVFRAIVLVLSSAAAPLATRQAAERQIVLRQGIPDSETSRAASSAALSSDGRFVAFVSMGELLPLDTCPGPDVYVMDRQTSTLTLETPARPGASCHRFTGTGHPRLSGDGRYLVFESGRDDVPGGPDTNAIVDVFVRDRLRHTTTRASNGLTDGGANHSSEAPAISDDGELVAFASQATNLVPGPDANGSLRDVYLLRRATKTVIRASVGSDGRQRSEGESHSVTLSADGRFLAFASSADLGTELERRDRSVRQSAVYVRDLVSGNTSCVSCSGALGPGRASHPHLSADGTVVVFAWQANRDQDADSPRTDIVLHDRIAAGTTVITKGANASSARARISGNGRYLAFESAASNLACARRRCPVGSGDENLLPDIYVFDRLSGRFRRASGGLEEWWVPSVGAWLDWDGTVLSFSSRQPLGDDDTTTDYDLFVGQVSSLPPRSATVR